MINFLIVVGSLSLYYLIYRWGKIAGKNEPDQKKNDFDPLLASLILMGLDHDEKDHRSHG